MSRMLSTSVVLRDDAICKAIRADYRGDAVAPPSEKIEESEEHFERALLVVYSYAIPVR